MNENKCESMSEAIRRAVEERRSRKESSDPAERRRRLDEAWTKLEKMRAEGPAFSNEEIWKGPAGGPSLTYLLRDLPGAVLRA
jgi:hypothetical protein